MSTDALRRRLERLARESEQRLGGAPFVFVMDTSGPPYPPRGPGVETFTLTLDRPFDDLLGDDDDRDNDL